MRSCTSWWLGVAAGLAVFAWPAAAASPPSLLALGSSSRLHLMEGTPPSAAAPAPFLPGAAIELGAGAAAALVSVPLTLLAGAWVGSLSANLLLAAIPSVILLAALPPLAVTAAVYFASAWWGGRPGRFSPAIWTTLAAHVLLVAGGVFLGASAQDLPSAALFTVAEALVLPAVAVGTMRLGSPRLAQTAPLLTVRF